jgi:hypothetical protein
MFQGLRLRAAEIVRREMMVLKALNRHSEETLGLNIQIEKTKFEKPRELCAYRGFADAADASEKYAHVAPPSEKLSYSWSIIADSRGFSSPQGRRRRIESLPTADHIWCCVPQDERPPDDVLT